MPAASSSPRTSSAPGCASSTRRPIAGDHDRAAEIDAELTPVYEATATTNPIPVKTGLELLGVADAVFRLPLVPASDEERERVRAALEGAGVLVASWAVDLSSTVRLLPLGGLGEIGKNMTVVEQDDRIVLVDTGLMFPTAEMLGIDLVLPDFSYLRERVDDIEAIVLTHGHEDHVGALPYVLREIGLPPAIYGGPLTIGLVRSKLEEHKIKNVPFEVIDTGEVVAGGPVRDRDGADVALDPRFARGGDRDRAGQDPRHRRLQVRPDPGRLRAGRHVAARRTRRRGADVPVRRLDQRRPAGRCALGVLGWPGAAADSSRNAKAASSSPASPRTCTASSR